MLTINLLKRKLKSSYYRLQSSFSSGELNEIGKIYKTDKTDIYHTFAKKSYLDVYSFYPTQFINEKITMLEIGIRDGSSLRTFRDFLKEGQLLGLDIDPKAQFKESRIKTYTGDQSSREIIDKIFKENPKIKIVLDDGSHVNELTLASFNLIFDRIEKGGYYIIEDLACTYLEDKLEEGIKAGNWPGMHLNNPSVLKANKRKDMDHFFLKLISDLDHRRGEIEYVHFWSQLCVIKKID